MAKGLVTKSSAPASKACTFSAEVDLADRTITGTADV